MLFIVFQGVLAALPLGMPAAARLLLPFLPLLLPSLAVGNRRQRLMIVLFWSLGFLVGAIRLPQPPPPGQVFRIEGAWQETRRREGLRFEGMLGGRPGLTLRGLGRTLPAPGSRFEASGRRLGFSEFRIESWSALPIESEATRVSRRARLDGRDAFARRLTRHFPADRAPLARALLLGSRRGMPWDIRRGFRNAGLAHLLALSGLHVGLFLLLLRRGLALGGLGSGLEWGILFLLPALPLLWGSSPSVIRALIMAAYLLLWRRRGGRPRAREAMSAAALLEFLFRPESLLGASFQLSYLATLALISLRMPPLPQARWPRLLRVVKASLHASLVCTVAGLPVLMTLFGRLALLGPLWNLPAGLLCAPALALGWLALPAAFTPGSELFAAPAALLLGGLASLADLAGGRLALVAEGGPPPVWLWLPWSLGLRRLIQRGKPALAVSLMLIPLLAWLPRPIP